MANRSPFIGKPPLGATINQSHSLVNGLVGLWLMNEGGGLTLTNLAAPVNKGTLTNGPTWAAGKFGPALSFDGTNDTVVMTSQPMTNTNNWSMSAWAKPSTLPQNERFIVHNGNDAGGYGFSIGGAGGTNSTLYGLYGSVAWIDSGYSFPTANVWYHVVMLRDSGTTKFFVNGVQAPNTSGSTPNTPNNFFEIGNQSGATSRNFTGSIDFVCVHNRVLTAAEITQLYVTPFSIFQAPKRRNIASVSVATSSVSSPISSFKPYGGGIAISDGAGFNF